MNKTEEEILDYCRGLGIDVSSKDDMLSEDAIIELDNIIDIDVDEEEIVGLVDTTKLKVDDSLLNAKLTKISHCKPKGNLQNKKKMYKQGKLISNVSVAQDNVVLYKNNMTVKEFSEAIGVNASK